MKTISALLLLITSLSTGAYASDQQTTSIGDLKLESGEVIRGCAVGYRVFGTLNQEKSNVVLFPTALGGRSADLAGQIGPARLVDSSEYYVIVIDSLGDGVSSSPSNSKVQPRMQFPRFSIRDIVNAEHRMLTDSLHLKHVYAVMGSSMGAMEALQWAVSYPEFMDKIVSLFGSPQLTSWEMLWQHTVLLALESDPDWKDGQYTTSPRLHLFASVFALVAQTPEYVASNTPTKEFEEFFDAHVAGGRFDANDYIRQIQACGTQDITATFGGSLERAAAAVRARVLIIVDRQDHILTPTSSIQFAKLVKAQVLELDSNCGHETGSCEALRIRQAVADFLQQ